MSDLTDPNDSHESVRIDAWTWGVRLFKTRSQAGSACRKEHVLVNGQRCRPSRRIRVGDQVQVKREFLVRTLEVKALLEKRVGAKLVDEYLIDRTPPEVLAEAAERAQRNRETVPLREAGTGRPTKRQRRDLDELMSSSDDEAAHFASFVRAVKNRR